MTIALNPSPTDERLNELSLEHVNCFVLNEIETCQLTGLSTEDPEALITALHAKFPRSKLVLTMGSAVSAYSNGQIILRQDIYKAPVADTTAAGDTFTSYFFAGIIAGDDLAALDRAAMASSICVSGEGAAPSIPTLGEVRDALTAL